MSRYIDPDEPLSPEDRAYLAERNKHRQIRLHDARVGGFAPKLVPTTPPPADNEPSGSGSVVVEPPADEEPANSDEDVEYVDSLNVDEMKAELKQLKKPVSGNRDELRARLLEALAAQD